MINRWEREGKPLFSKADRKRKRNTQKRGSHEGPITSHGFIEKKGGKPDLKWQYPFLE